MTPSSTNVPVSLTESADNPPLTKGSLVSIVNPALPVADLTLPATSVIETLTSGVPSGNTVPAGRFATQFPVASAIVVRVLPAMPMTMVAPASALPAKIGEALLVTPSATSGPVSFPTPATTPAAIPTTGTVTRVSRVNSKLGLASEMLPATSTARTRRAFAPSVGANVVAQAPPLRLNSIREPASAPALGVTVKALSEAAAFVIRSVAAPTPVPLSIFSAIAGCPGLTLSNVKLSSLVFGAMSPTPSPSGSLTRTVTAFAPATALKFCRPSAQVFPPSILNWRFGTDTRVPAALINAN